MHAVILNTNSQNNPSDSKKIYCSDNKEYILCHIRKIDMNYNQK